MSLWSFQKAGLAFLAALTLSATAAFGQARILTADGQTDTYKRIKSVLYSSPETPDCAHLDFGPHITYTTDDYLKKYVFAFNIHVTPDNDRCSKFDRQRLEIKTEGNSSTPNYLKGLIGETVTYRWLFKLPTGFQPSTSFTHIHQIKPYDGDADNPVITLTPRKGSPNRLELIHINSKGVTTKVAQTPLEPFVGRWVEAYEKLTYGYNGQYSIVLSDPTDGTVLFTYSNDNLDLWRTGTITMRPKWGIYRSLTKPSDLRDEQVLYDRFCLAKGTDDCTSLKESPEFTLAVAPSSGTAANGGSASFDVNINSLNSFSDEIKLSVTGLPEGATAQFTPAIIGGGQGTAKLVVTTAAETTAGQYPIVVNAISGALSHIATVPLTVTIDSTVPETTAATSPSPNVNGWNNSDVTVTLAASDDSAGSGVKQITYSATGAQQIEPTVVPGASASFSISAEGITTVSYSATDRAGNIEPTKNIVVRLDKTPPSISGSRTPGANANGWNNTSVTVAFQCTDALSGVAAGSPSAPTTVSGEGANQSVTGSCTDLAGNSATATVGGISIDLTPPVIACNASPDVIWPPNHKFVPVNIAVSNADVLSGSGGFALSSALSNEGDKGDILFAVGTAATNGSVRAERLGSGTGRVYSFSYTGLDLAGNSALCSTNVIVPHDRGRN